MVSISIITIVRNDPQGLRRTAKSVIEQSSGPVEWIVVDGDSGPETQVVLEEIRGYCSSLVSEPDDGIYDAMTKGFSRSGCPWIIFMNAGDSFADPNVLGDAMAILEGSPERSIVYGDAIESPPVGEARVRRAPGFGSINFGMPASHQSIFYSRDVLEEFPLNNDSNSGDWVQLLEIYASNVQTIYFERTICQFDTTGVSNVHWKNSIQERIAYLKQSGMWSWRVAARYQRIIIHAHIANTLRLIMPRSAWIWLAQVSRKFLISNRKSRS